MAEPTLKNPVIVKDDGTVSMLLPQGRTLTVTAFHRGLLNHTGYKARLGFSEARGPGATLLLLADSDEGDVVFVPVYEDGQPETEEHRIGTRVVATVRRAQTVNVTEKKGYVDFVLEQPGGEEPFPLMAGDWILFPMVTP